MQRLRTTWLSKGEAMILMSPAPHSLLQSPLPVGKLGLHFVVSWSSLGVSKWRACFPCLLLPSINDRGEPINDAGANDHKLSPKDIESAVRGTWEPIVQLHAGNLIARRVVCPQATFHHRLGSEL